MPIITKPSPLEKDATGVFSLDKTALALHPIVVASSHFSSPNVWDKIIVKYKSETLGQFESIEFDATLASPEGQFFVSETAEDIFEVEKITIIDKDGAILLIPRAELTVAQFDIDFSASGNSSPVISYLSYDINNVGATLNATGGVSLGSSGDDVYAKMSSGDANDFAFEWKFNWSLINPGNVILGVTSTAGSGLWYESLTCLEGLTSGGPNPEKARLWVNGTPGVLSDITIPDGDNFYKLVRVGTTITHYLNGVSIYSSNVSLFTAYPTVRTKGLAACSQSYTTYLPGVQELTWNVAGKTGVGTVTAGANGLITKSAGGTGYNVNVLSNETITSDGYVEFIWSHINVVFGIAETIHPSGSYTNIIYGGYNAGYGWEIYAPNAFNGSGIANNSLTVGDVVKIERVGSLYKAFKNGLLMHTCTINNLNPLKASISINSETNGVNGATISL